MILFGNSEPMTVQLWLFVLSLLLFPAGLVVFIYLFMGSLARDAARRPRNDADVLNTTLSIAFVLYFPIVAVSMVKSTTNLVIFVVAIPALASLLVTHSQWKSPKITEANCFVAFATILCGASLWLPAKEAESDPLLRVLVVPVVWLIGYAIAMTIGVRDYLRRQNFVAHSECPSCAHTFEGMDGSDCPKCPESISETQTLGSPTASKASHSTDAAT